MDGRDLNYEKYFEEGGAENEALEDYTSHNTKRLSVDEVIKVLKKLNYIQRALND